MAKKKSKLKLVTHVVEQDVSAGCSVEVSGKVENYPAKRRALLFLVLTGFYSCVAGVFFLVLFVSLVQEDGLVGFFKNYWFGFVVCSLIFSFMVWRVRKWWLEFCMYK